MPTPDASAFTRQQKLRAYEQQRRDGDLKLITHLYQPIVTTTGLVDFLPSFTNKVASPYTRFTKYTNPAMKGGTIPGGSGVAGSGYLNVTPVKSKYIQ